MDIKLATSLSQLVITNSKELNATIKEMRNGLTEEEFNIYIKKLSHVMALYFDILDLIGNEYPELNPYSKNNEQPASQSEAVKQRIKEIEAKAIKKLLNNNNNDPNTA